MGKSIDSVYEMKYNCYISKGGTDMAQLSIRIDDNVKKRAEQACEALGLTMSTAINIYLVKLGNEKRIPFEVAVDPFYSKTNQDILQKAIKQLEEGRGKEHELMEDEG